MADEQSIKLLDDKKVPYVLFSKIKNYVANGSLATDDKPGLFALRLDSTHNSPQAIINYTSNGCVVKGHKHLSAKEHGPVLALLGSFDRTLVDPRLLEDAPKSALKEKVNEQRAKS